MRILNNGNIGIGITAPIGQFHMVNTAGTEAILTTTTGRSNLIMTGPAGGSYLGAYVGYNVSTASLELGQVTNGSASNNPWMDIKGSSGKFAFTSIGGAAVPPNLNLIRANGLAAMTNAGILGKLSFDGYNGIGNSIAAAQVAGVATENWASSYNGAGLTFSTTQNGATSPYERMRINHDGNVGIGTTTPAALLTVFNSTTGPAVLIERSANSTKPATVNFAPAGAFSTSNVTWIVGMPPNQNNYQVDYFDGSTMKTAMSITNTGTVHFPAHVGGVNGSPTPSACGTSPTVMGSDLRGTITMGSGGGLTQCTLTFENAYVSTPVCVLTLVDATAGSVIVAVDPSTSNTQLVIKANTAMNSKVVNYICMQ